MSIPDMVAQQGDWGQNAGNQGHSGAYTSDIEVNRRLHLMRNGQNLWVSGHK